MPIPYLGSKRKIADNIVNVIINSCNKFDTVVDLFCGGFAISEVFLNKGYKVVANDKNEYVIALLHEVLYNKLDEDIITQWISKEFFLDVINNPSKFPNWFVGFVSCIWSFGNNQKGYLYGKNNEQLKKYAHDLIIYKNKNTIQNYIPKEFINNIIKHNTWKKRKKNYYKIIKILKNRKLELQHLKQIERLQHLERLQLTNLNYDEVNIPNNAIIYCDPPYFKKAEYKINNFDHSKFWNFVRNKSKENLIFVSEYIAPKDFICIFEIKRKSTLCINNQSHNNQPTEKLFIHKDNYDKINKLTLF